MYNSSEATTQKKSKAQHSSLHQLNYIQHFKFTNQPFLAHGAHISDTPLAKGCKTVLSSSSLSHEPTEQQCCWMQPTDWKEAYIKIEYLLNNSSSSESYRKLKCQWTSSVDTTINKICLSSPVFINSRDKSVIIKTYGITVSHNGLFTLNHHSVSGLQTHRHVCMFMWVCASLA